MRGCFLPRDAIPQKRRETAEIFQLCNSMHHMQSWPVSRSGSTHPKRDSGGTGRAFTLAGQEENIFNSAMG